MNETNNTITRLFIFDCDGTLLNSPEPTEENKNRFDRHHNISKYPHRGWWSKIESFDRDVFDVKVIPSILTDYNRAKRDPDGLMVMLTSRMPYFEERIKELLDNNGLYFDVYLFKSGQKEKSERVNSLLRKYPDTTYIEIWDDRQKEIDLYQKWSITMKPEIYIKINHV